MKKKVFHEIEVSECGKYPEHIWEKYWRCKNLEGETFFEDLDEIFPQAQLISSRIKKTIVNEWLQMEIRINRFVMLGKYKRKILTVSVDTCEKTLEGGWYRNFEEIVLKDTLLTPVLEDWDYTEEVFENETA